jgi:ectoine hydroxylase-related dioxygenase (phytanoyl-CoA dioxygenase family)
MSFCTQIKHNGFAVVQELIPPDKLNWLCDQISLPGIRRSRAGVRHAFNLPQIVDFAQEECLLDLAREILGTDAFAFHATLFDKSPQSNWLIVWHQDTALPLRERHEVAGWGPWSVKEGMHYAHAPAAALSRIVALRVHLDDSTVENGPIRFLPGTHTMGVLSDDSIHELSTKIAPVECAVPRGGVLAMRPLLVHASSKSGTGAPRRVLHIEYAVPTSIPYPLQLATPQNQRQMG